MNSLDTQTLKHDLKSLIIEECDKEDDYTTDDVTDHGPLFGPDSQLDLDSLDALQISVAILNKYGVRIEGAKQGRIAFASINALADYIINDLGTEAPHA